MSDIRIVKFGAEWCGPCKQQDKELAKLDYKVEYINVEEEEEMVEKHNIRTVPTTLILQGNEEVHRFIGLTKASAINEYLNTLQDGLSNNLED